MWRALALCVCIAAVAAQDDIGGREGDVEATWQWKENGLAYMVQTPGDCHSYVVEEGDIVYITHAGFAEDGRQIDANVKDELFKVTIGTRMVLQGMEQGMVGQCVGETRTVRMPPHWAFDDPNLNFNQDRKPVPRGSTVNYHITVHEVRRPGTVTYFWVTVVRHGGTPGLIFLIIVIGVIYTLYDSHTKQQKRGKKRR